MILVYAGRRVDPVDPAAARRFPPECVPRVVHEIDMRLRELRPSSVVGSAACGSDLLVLEAAGHLLLRRRIVLPFDRETFRATSVVDRPGDWGSRFDAVIQEVSARGDLVELALDPNDAGIYERANAEIFRQAESLVRTTPDVYHSLVLWNGVSRGNGDVTEAFVNEARRRGWPVDEIDTSITGDKTRLPAEEL